ncbi:MAG: phosphate/phosphonate ABC transporter permease, partial [Acidobacteria bacterium]|nr:phosphate/phosphonate ABC transporter permease [Acidobacteriota bacterium]
MLGRRQGGDLTLRRVAVAVVCAGALALCWRAAEIRPLALFEAGALASAWAFVRGLFPPDFSPAFLRVVAAAVGQTLAIAVAGTALSILIGLPLGVLSTATLWRRGALLEGENESAGARVMAAVSRATRALLGFLRAVPDLVWGLLFVVAVGLGSLAGTLGLAVAYGGVLGRVYADVFEDVDPRPVEALRACGATRAQVFLRAVWPQAAPSLTVYTLYSLECSVRAASVLGFVGAGGIGYEINLSMRMFEYGQVTTLILAFVLLLTANDAFSRFLRRRLHAARAPEDSLASRLKGRVVAFVAARAPRALARQAGWVAGRAAWLALAAAVCASFYVVGFRQ